VKRLLSGRQAPVLDEEVPVQDAYYGLRTGMDTYQTPGCVLALVRPTQVFCRYGPPAALLLPSYRSCAGILPTIGLKSGPKAGHRRFPHQGGLVER
jgi:hypothetical protein